MCGFAGMLDGAGASRDVVEAMGRTLAHRGPDGEGLFVEGPVGLAHRRLAIVDLEGGAQPLRTEDGALALVANGEIYNHEQLRRELESKGRRFRTRSDSEVILHGFAEWGLGVLPKLRGMFAFALWDAQANRVYLARDRFGEKPLCYALVGRKLLFGSEPKAVVAGLGTTPSLSAEGLARYVALDFVPAPWSIFEGIRKVPPGHVVVAHPLGMRVDRWWRLPDAAPFNGSVEDAGQALRGLFDRAVGGQLMSDVPLGVLLSGGLDSTLVADAAMRGARGTLDAFSIGFDGAGFDEAPAARETARRLGLRHHEARFTPRAMMDALPELLSTLDEPLADPALLPQHLLSKLARQQVKVVLGGDGADELLCGYDSFLADRVDGWTRSLGVLRAYGAKGLAALWPASDAHFGVQFRLRQLAQGLSADDDVRGLAWTTTFGRDDAARLFPRVSGIDPYAEAREEQSADPVERAVRQLVRVYLEGDILAKVDRAAMAHGLEVRSPFLDHELAEFIASLPVSWRLHGPVRKWILKRAFADRLPSMPAKHGFWVPVAQWIRKDLRAWFDEVLLDGPGTGLVDRAEIETLLAAHRSGRANLRKPIWNLTMLHLWHARWGRRPS